MIREELLCVLSAGHKTFTGGYRVYFIKCKTDWSFNLEICFGFHRHAEKEKLIDPLDDKLETNQQLFV